MRLSVLAAMLAVALSLALGGCGRKGDLDPPPDEERRTSLSHTR